MALKELNAARVEELWSEGTRNRQSIDQEVYQNLAFLMDEHYIRFDKTLTSVLRPPDDDGRIRLTINHIKALWRADLGRLIKARPIPEVIAASDSDEDRDTAKASNRILNSELERLDFERLRLNLMTWVTSAGFSYLHPHWDTKSSQIVCPVVTAGELVRDPSVRTNINEGQWVIHGKFMTEEQAYEAFGREFAVSSSHHRMVNLSNFVSGWKFDGVSAGQEGVLVLRAWHKSCRRYPEGLVLTVVNGEEVERIEQFPFDHGELPFIDFHYYQLPGRFEGQSFIRPLWGPQRDYNHSRSKRAEARVIFGSPGLLAPENSMDEDRITAEAGQVITYRPTGVYKPEPLTWGPPSNHFFQEEEVAYGEMQEMAHIREVSKGQVPSAGLPATAVQMLQEADETALGPIALGFERAIARTGRQLLGLVRQYWTTDRAIRVWSQEQGRTTIERFKGSDIAGQFDVQVVPGSALPRNKTAQRQDILALWDKRIVQDPRLVVRYMEMPNSDGIMRMLDVDTQHAQREHDRIYKRWTDGSEDAPVLPEKFHNHQIHIAEHNDERKKESFGSWPVEAKAELADHVTAHEELMKQLMIEQAAEAAALQPTQPEPGTNTLPGINAPEPVEELV